jgi:hypothetical protein
LLRAWQSTFLSLPEFMPVHLSDRDGSEESQCLLGISLLKSARRIEDAISMWSIWSEL